MFKKISKLSASPRAKKAISLMMCLAMCLCMFCVMASAVDGSTATINTPVEAGEAFFDILSEQINLTTIIGIIGISAASCLGIYLGVFAIRKVGSAALRALKGRFKVG